MIKVQNVVKHYGKVEAVKGVSFTVEKGEIFGFLGSNGAGKTTTIRMMIGLLKPTSGEIFINGKNVATDAKAIHKKIGIVFEDPNFYERLSIEDNLYFYADLHQVSKEKVDELIDSFQLSEKRKTPMKKLSKGQKQRMTIIRSILHQPEILFLDEPTSGLDPTSSKIIRDQIRKLNEMGTTIILTTHYMEEADQLCNRIIFINQGQIVAQGKPHELKLKYGQRTIEVEYTKGEEILKESLTMEEESTPDRISQLLKNENVLTIHSREATLAEVFIELTGGGIL
ncbi:MAG: ABC transporter ATP-binding protein [Halanaerobiales bacterium]|nr:ABC transporter ATP-binding protein [Halanaerobiales bacterium]